MEIKRIKNGISIGGKLTFKTVEYFEDSKVIGKSFLGDYTYKKVHSEKLKAITKYNEEVIIVRESFKGTSDMYCSIFKDKLFIIQYLDNFNVWKQISVRV